eukprot:scaffold223865_cov66-Attheya_sp.AAC.4
MGQMFTMSVDDYSQAIFNYMLTFDQAAPYPIDVHRVFSGNLAPIYKDELEKTYKAHMTIQSQNAYHQLTIPGNGHHAATIGEKSIHNTMQIVQLSNANAHGFLLFPVFQSPAEKAQFITELPAVIKYHMPYYTADGSPISLKIAIGKHVAINLILGLTFLQSSNTQMDLNDSVADCKLLFHPSHSTSC